ncbi:hypothetical protein J6590_089064 [Homalodisca vitripennis]|nr:hypothetical protein J6590_089064 [Homalodisca vitripennis]
MENVRKRGATIHSREREVIRRVIEICDKEASDKVFTVPLAKATDRAANYCKVSKQSIKRTRKEAKSTPAEKLMSPGKKTCWQSLEVDGVLPDMNAANRVILVDIGSQDGFLKDGRLIYKANCSTGVYHGQMNGVNLEK